MLNLNSLYEVIIYSVGDTKSGTKMGKLQVKDTQDGTVLNCIMWEETISRIEEKTFRTGNIIKILKGTYNEKYNNCLVSDIELVKEAKAGLTKDEQDEIFKKILNEVEKIKDTKLKDFVIKLLFEEENNFKTKPAAKLMHHNYTGGLLEHTYECLMTAKEILKLYPNKLNEDEIIAAVTLHDYGKIFEYSQNEETGIIEYNEDFRKTWLTHSQWGYSVCMTNGFVNVAKMIAAHHGRTEWGSIIDLSEKDLEADLYIVHHIDDLSAKLGKISIADL